MWIDSVDHEPDTIDIALASLDRPDEVPPGFHIWISSRIRWLQYAGNREGVS